MLKILENLNETFTLVKFEAHANFNTGLQTYEKRSFNEALDPDPLAPREFFYGLYSQYTNGLGFVWSSHPTHEQIQEAMFEISNWLVGE